MANLDHIFHSLADGTRRAVIAQLANGPASISDLAQRHHMALPSFMKHIRVLEESGLIGSKKVGRVRTCTLEHDRLTAVERWFNDQRAIWESRHRNLDSLLTRLGGDQS
jgi:DNA-binding transcriptional ArsR family regulator